MKTITLDDAKRLGDRDLLARLRDLSQDERTATVELIVHLAEVDARRLYVGEGYGSLFSYCTAVLRLSEHATYARIEAARAARLFPCVLERLATGALNLSALRRIAPHLTEANHLDLLAEVEGRNTREVNTIVARLAPQSDVPSSIRKVPVRILMARTPPGDTRPQPPLSTKAPEALSPSGPPAGPLLAPAPRPVVAPLAPGRYRVQFTVGAETHAVLEDVQRMLRREIPNGDPAAIFDRALRLLQADLRRRKKAATRAPRKPRPPLPGSRHVPTHVVRAVIRRDEDRCAFVAPDGTRCPETSFLELHHRHPYALGGPPTVANISLRCRPHNRYEAELVFGKTG